MSFQNHDKVKTAYSLALGIPDRFIHGDDQACGLHRAADRIDFNQARLPDERLQVVTDAIKSIDINTNPLLAVRVFHAKLV